MTEASKQPTKRLYWATMPFMNYVFKDGKMAIFKHHRYATDVEEEIAELDREVAKNHPYIYIKEDQKYVTAEMEDPMKALRAKFFAEFQAQQAAFVDPGNDMGNSKQDSIRPQSTTDIAAVAAGGDATQSAAKLVAMANKAAAATPASK